MNSLANLDSKPCNNINGGAVGDTINGQSGSDTLTGNAGKDVFVFSTALGTSNVDTTTDFVAVDDTVRLENAIFSELTSTGTLSSSYFRANTTGTVQDTNDFIIYETDTGKLFYDSNGSASDGAMLFAVLTGHATITAADFAVI